MRKGIQQPVLQRKECAKAYQTVQSLQNVKEKLEELASLSTNVAIVAIRLSFATQVSHSSTTQIQTHSIYTVLEHIRPRVRKTDTVLWHHQTLYFLLPGATLQGGQIVLERLWEALLWRIHQDDENVFIRPQHLTIGTSAYPTPCTKSRDCLIQANLPIYNFVYTSPSLSEKQTMAMSTSFKNLTEAPQQIEQSYPSERDEQINCQEDLSEVARNIGVPYLSFLPRTLPTNVKRLVNRKLAHELCCYPVGQERGTLTVAILNPHDRHVLDRLHQETGLRIFPVLAHPQELQLALEHF